MKNSLAALRYLDSRWKSLKQIQGNHCSNYENLSFFMLDCGFNLFNFVLVLLAYLASASLLNACFYISSLLGVIIPSSGIHIICYF